MDAKVSRSKDPGRPGELRDSGYGFGDRHYLILHNVGGCLQVPTLIAGAPGCLPVNILPKWNYFDKVSHQIDLSRDMLYRTHASFFGWFG